MRIEQGATFRRVFYIEFEEATPTWDITGYIARMQIRSSVTSDTIILTASTENGRMVIGPDPTQLSLTITDEDTADLPSGVFVYDLELESPIGEVIRLLKGSVVVDPEVTR